MWKKERGSLPALFLLVNSVVWFAASWLLIDNLVRYNSLDVIPVSASYFASLLAAAIIGATFLKKRLKGKWSLTVWILLGTIAYLVAAVFVHKADSLSLTLLSIPFGGLAGLGIPTCLALFSEATVTKNRGRQAGIAFFLIQVSAALIYAAGQGANLENVFLVLAAWRFTGILGSVLWKPSGTAKEEHKVGLSVVIRERTFLLYFVAWFLFTIVNFVEQPLLEKHFAANYDFYSISGILITSVTAILGGMLCDFKGRRVSGILGFIFLGIGYAFLSLFPANLFVQILWVVLEGIAWGVLYVTFILVVWGDMSDGRTREHYYLLGCMPFLLSNLISSLVRPFVDSFEIVSTFSIASFFLFLAILPLFYAPETLPEKVMKDRDLKSYVEKAKKKLQAEEQKAQKNEQEKPNQEPEEDLMDFEVKSEEKENEYEEAQKLAEKYY